MSPVGNDRPPAIHESGRRPDGPAGKTRPAEFGFSLIEVLVALTILALVLTLVYRLQAGGLTGIAMTEGHARALSLAESRLAALQGERRLQPGRVTGAEGAHRWILTVTPRGDVPFDAGPSQGWTAYRVHILVSWDQGRSLTLETTMLGALP